MPLGHDGRCDAASSEAPIADYRRFLRPCLTPPNRARSAKRHSVRASSARALGRVPWQQAPPTEGATIPAKEEKIELEGEVIESLRDGKFRIALDNGHETLGYTAGKMRRFRIRINPGDRIKVELSPYDLQRGRIVYRYR